MDKKELSELKNKFRKQYNKVEKLFLEKTKIYGNAFFDEDVTDVERWFGGLQRKMIRLNNYYRNGGKSSFESLSDTYQDICVYSLLQLILIEQRNDRLQKHKRGARKCCKKSSSV